MPNKDAGFLIGLRWRGWSEGEQGIPDTERGLFDVNVGYDDPTDDRDQLEHGDVPIEIDLVALRTEVDDEASYGEKLSAQLFASEKIRGFYLTAKGAARDLRLHLRLHIDPSAPAPFHRIRWECLRDPVEGTRIALQANFLFSRYLSASDWRSLQPARKHQLKALVVIANPDLSGTTPGGRELEPVKVDEELARAREALALDDQHRKELVGVGKATLPGILAALRDEVDILYLVAHGAMVGGEPIVYLEGPGGVSEPVEGWRLAQRVAQLEKRPRVAILCSCESGGAPDGGTTVDEGALAPLGPRLATAGIPAVVAMQGNVTMTTAGQFLTEFFDELKRHGVVDEATAAGRREVQDEHDWWVPVLYSCLRKGRTYYRSAFVDKVDATWNDLIDAIRARECTPIIGPALADQMIGPRDELARRWVDRWEMPIRPSVQQDLTTVAQYLRVQTARQVPARTLCNYLRTDLRERYGGQLENDLLENGELEDIVNELGKRDRQASDAPYRVLTTLSLPIYVTTSWTGLLEEALGAATRAPTTAYFDWRTQRPDDDPIEERPRWEQPLVYHLFGRLNEPESLVLTEDDHFEWLCAWVDKRRNIPRPVSRALTRKSLLFLGYKFDDWDFRILFQGFKTFGGSSQLRDFQHVGVQLDPSSQVIEPESAQEYLESYFGEDKVSIYWGHTNEFLGELSERMKAR